MSDLDESSPAGEAAKRVAGWVIFVVLALAILAAVLGLFLLGPLGLVIGIPVAIVLALAFSSSGSGPAAGA